MTNCFSQKVCADSWASSPTTLRYRHGEVVGNGHQVSKQKAKSNEAKIPTVRVRLLQSVRLLPHQAVVAQVQLVNKQDGSELLLLERSMQVEEETGLQIEDALLQPPV